MEVDDDDKQLLNSLGIASENPEDIERRVLSEREADLVTGDKEDANVDKLAEEADAQVKLYNKLQAVKVEIEAVASTLQNGSDDSEIAEAGESVVDAVPDESNLQHALAKDRLRSLEKAKIKLEREISEFGYCVANGDVLGDKKKAKLLEELVREKPVRKQKLKTVGESSRGTKRPYKIVSYKDDDDFDAALDAASSGFMETKRDELVRKGMLTPFYKLKGFERRIQQQASSNRQDEVEEDLDEDLAAERIAKAARAIKEIEQARPTTKLLDAEDLPRLDTPTIPFQRLKTPLKRPGSPRGKDNLDKKKAKHKRERRPQPDKRWKKSESKKDEVLDERGGDAIEVSHASNEEEGTQTEDDDSSQSGMVLEGGLKIPGTIFSKLFDYQKVGVQWLWELHCQRSGGIIGDEMGLGKTIQVISFLAALHFSKMYKPSIVVCPVTLLRQWQREVKTWYPDFEVEILHDSACDSSKKNTTKFTDSDSDYESSLDSDTAKPSCVKVVRGWDDMIDRVVKSDSGLLLTTYEQLRILGDKLLDIEWGYAVLDEGHRIRNPNAEITLVCKGLQTVHRIIMTGAPIQNKLAELWSLFDFVFPGKLGVLPVFEAEFAVPITVGGYANATPLQVSTAYRCAIALRDLIMPYLLRRMKADVNAQLPKKTEHVLFCSLTLEQRSVYRAFLASSEVEQIFDGRKNSLYGIDIMRKICNHPDLLEREHAAQNPDYGNPERSGKMKIVCQVLKVWKEQGHRALLFAQTQQMLDIIENFLSSSAYTYRRMDGYTPVKQRMALMDEFNNSDEVFIFILTTKVGGLGTNLTGADRVIIYDPDWNPSTDMQARERAWRIGQTRDVTVYRLITRGTIEEKVYHRQIYKHFLTNKILKNPQQRRFFKARDMKDLFTLHEDQDGKLTETSNIFGQLAEDINVGVGSVDRDKPGSSSSVASEAEMLATRTSPGLDKISTNAKGKEKTDHDDSDSAHGETSILKCLFNANGLHSAVNHDAIINANDNEKVVMEQQASQVAQRAAQALRESRMLRSRESFAVPTWTGRAGAAGAPSSAHKRFGSTLNSRLLSSRSTEGSSSGSAAVAAGTSNGKALSSAELLARIRGTQEKAIGDALELDLDMASNSNRQERTLVNQASGKPSRKLMIVQPEVLIRQLCTFIQQRGGYTDSASITQHFKDRIREEDSRLFKNLLKEIATLEKSPNGTRWVLKPDYR